MYIKIVLLIQLLYTAPQRANVIQYYKVSAPPSLLISM